MSARLLAVAALGCAGAAVLIGVPLLVLAGPHGVGLLLAALAGLAAVGVGAWWVLAHRGLLRLLGALLAAAAVVIVPVLFFSSGLWGYALAAAALWAAGLACARQAVRQRSTAPAHAVVRPPPEHPWIVMNPRSGGGKVGEFALVERARALGCEVVVLDADRPQDVAALARQALADGADLLGVAGGDGTQALVAGVASAHDVPFAVVPAGTLNHFAMDLGLDLTDPARALDALSDGLEVRVDLGAVSGRPFVNTVSFGAYADIVQNPAYRDAKAATVLDVLPGLLSGGAGTPFTAETDGAAVEPPQALLVSNNPYAAGGFAELGRRPRLDSGRLGVRSIRITGIADAADLAVRGERAMSLSTATAREVTVSAGPGTLPVAVDGEALQLPTPVICVIRPRALRVRVPLARATARPASFHGLWRRVVALALRGGPERAAGGGGRGRRRPGAR
ncbi:diacylglycerol/lipid kinase family protein [Streptomyces sp. NPDC020141]|uniref:diacylglycerol/lipid kinase family protein n=1 Tax=Streptomyces sp. NPDC020141 TaxID=3365065 RepID=UPI00378E4581